VSEQALGRAPRWRDPLSPRSLGLWAGVAVPPLAWAVQRVLGDMLFEVGCGPGVERRELAGLTLEAWSAVVTIATAAVTVAAGVLALRAWRRVRSRADGARLDRARAMSMMGVASAALYLALIVFGFFPPFLLETCAPVP
jgi:hypothetical protein